MGWMPITTFLMWKWYATRRDTSTSFLSCLAVVPVSSTLHLCYGRYPGEWALLGRLRPLYVALIGMQFWWGRLVLQKVFAAKRTITSM